VALLAVGLTHREAPVEVRERLAISSADLDGAIERLAEVLPEAVILSTCNRTEIFANVPHRGPAVRAATMFLESVSGLPEGELIGHLRSEWQENAARHLFRVAAGLDSLIVGEGQILGQVRDAYECATRQRPVGPELARLFESALVVGKRARTETSVARAAVSVSQAAVDLARQSFGSLEHRVALVIGAGKMGELAARSLIDRGVGRVLVMNRTAARAEALVARLGGEAWPLKDLDAALALADVVISSTAAEEYLVTSRRLAPLLVSRPERPLLLVDIAVPRDVEPTVGTLEGVSLFNVDDLRAVCSSNLEARRREAARIEIIIEQELDKYVQWWQAREVAPTIQELVSRAETIRKDELSRALGRLGDLSERDANTLNALTVAIVNKLLHAPIVRLKERSAGMDGRHYLHAIRELFDLPATARGLD
jgi:glutamyl-tRNA reductase